MRRAKELQHMRARAWMYNTTHKYNMPKIKMQYKNAQERHTSEKATMKNKSRQIVAQREKQYCAIWKDNGFPVAFSYL